jgi:hypothetical protein
MKILIIQENGHHDKNRNFRECFCLQRGFEHHGAKVDIWGKGHDGFDPSPDQRMYDQYFSHFDLVLAIENWDWMPDINRIHTSKFIWAIDAHCKSKQVYEQYGFDKVLHATPEFASEGCWLPNAYDDTIIKPLQNSYYKRLNIGFCGNKVNRGEFIKFLGKHFGSNFRHDEMVIGDDMVRAINSYKVHWNMNIGMDINYRNFETMGCQTCLLTSTNKHYKELGFIDGENCLVWSSPEEIKSLAEYAIGNDKKRESIAVAGYELVKEKHTYKHRAHRILEMIK